MSVKVPVLDHICKQVGELALDEMLFDVPTRADVLHQVVLWQDARRRSGCHSTQVRREVSGSGRKPHRQKGTGRARLGSIRAPHCRGGGVAFGPKYRDHSYKLNKKVRKLGLRIAVSDRVRSGVFKVIEGLGEVNKTQQMRDLMRNMCGNSKRLIVSTAPLDAVNNLFNTRCISVTGLNVKDILSNHVLLVQSECMEALIQKLR